MNLPDACLVILVGPAGSGKSTFAQRHFAPAEIVSSDAFRALIAEHPGDMWASGPAFSMVRRRTAARLAQGLRTVVDATSVHRSSRRTLLGLARAAGRPAVAIVFDLPLEVCSARNAGRERPVPQAVLERQHVRMRGSLHTLPGEGFAFIHVIHDGAGLA